MTELIWEGKYVEGRKQGPVKISLPFQTIETINESADDRRKGLLQFERPTEWRNRLIWGDKKYVLPSLLEEFAGKVNLIYIDPPFNVGADFSFTASIPDHPEAEDGEASTFIKEPSIIEQKAYRDTWGRGLDSYMQWFYEAAILLKELLHENGSIYVHLDWHIGHYAKCILDEVFGYDNFRNEIVWKRASTIKGNFGQGSKLWSPNVESIFFYTKSQNYPFNHQFKEYTEDYIKAFYKYEENDGRKYRLISMIGPGGESKGNPVYEVMGIRRAWRYSRERMNNMIKDGLIVQTTPGTVPQKKQYLDEGQGVALQTLWEDLEAIGASSNERVQYATQKPEVLLERILKASSNEGDLILDCFCGSGTTAAVAEKLTRRWICCDLGRFAIHTTRKRVLQLKNVKPFIVQNLGKYERQQWMQAEFQNPADHAAQEIAYHNFIIQLYHAQPMTGYIWLHGSRAGRMVHVGGVEAPVSSGDVKNIVQEFWKIVGKNKDVQKNGIDILGWDFAFELNEMAAQFAAANKVDLKFKKIPREVLERKAVEQGDIKFFEMASLSIKTKTEKKKLKLDLSNFIIPPDDVPEEVRGKIVHWSQWIDYWAIDWDFKDDTFHNQWQSYRTKSEPKIELSAANVYEKSGKYMVLIKVIDILGNDTTKMVNIEI